MITVFSGPWQERGFVIVKRSAGGLGRQTAIIMPNGTLAGETVDLAAIDTLEAVPDLDAPSLRDRPALRQTASFHFANRKARGQLALLRLTDGRESLLKVADSDMSLLAQLASEAQRVRLKAAPPPTSEENTLASATAGSADRNNKRRANPLLIAGILFLPFIFVWWLLRRGHSTTARAVGFGWLAIFVWIAASNPPSSPVGGQTNDQTIEVSNEATASQQILASDPEVASAERANEEAEEAAAAASQARIEYVARLEREMRETSTETFLRNSETTETIIISVAMFSALASLYADGAELGLTDEQEAVRQRFRTTLISWQRAALPELRNRFGPAMSRVMWENDMEVRTIGNGYRTVEFIWAGFAANRNIAEFQASTRENISALRFSRTQYRWFRGADQYTYYDLEGVPSDSDLVVVRNGTFVQIE